MSRLMQNQIDELSRQVKVQKEQLDLHEKKIKQLNTNVSSRVTKKSRYFEFESDRFYYYNEPPLDKRGPNPTGMY
jgi:hypothetical protein